MLIKLISQIISQQDSGKPEIPTGSGLKTDPYNWYKILDPNNSNGCHTMEINQNAEEGWVKLYLNEGTTYAIGQCNLPNGDSWDGYIYLYDITGETQLASDDDNTMEINGVSCKGYFNFMPDSSGYYMIKASSYSNQYQDQPCSLHCDPAPINAGGELNEFKTPHNLTANDSDPRYILSQSSDIDGTRLAYKAMDGFNANSDFDCSHTVQGNNEWWKIEFTEGPVKISSFTFTNRSDRRI